MWGDDPNMSMAGNTPIGTRFNPDYINDSSTPRDFRIYRPQGAPYKHYWWPSLREPPLDLNHTDNTGFDTFIVGHFHQDVVIHELKVLALHQMVTT